MKTAIKTFIVLLFLMGCTSATDELKYKNSTYTITFEINDTVYIDNEYVYIECKPHTIHKDSFVYFNFSTKQYEGVFDCYLGFESLKTKPCDDSKEAFIHEKYNKNNWYKIDTLKVLKNKTYSVKAWIDINESKTGNYKYNFGIKPNKLSFEAATEYKCFYILDPYYEYWYNKECPRSGEHPCNKSMFIDLGNKQFLYLQTSYLCGDVNGNGLSNAGDLNPLFTKQYNCNPPIINYQIFDYNNYMGTNIIRPKRSDIYD